MKRFKSIWVVIYDRGEMLMRTTKQEQKKYGKASTAAAA
jgi:hypothetical protein